MEEEILLPEETTEGAPNEALPLPDESTEAVEESPSPAPVDYEALAKEDLAAIKMLSPELSAVNHLSELPFARRFAELRELGLSVKEALFATRTSLPTQSGKEHLRSSVPRAKGTCEGCLSPEEMRAAKDLFYGLSEKEIHALYARVSAR